MDRKKFFDALRSSPDVFGKSLSVENVLGTEAILDAAIKYHVADPEHVAHIMAHVYRETGGYMMPIKETVMPYHKDKNPTDATVINRLDSAFAKGQLKWVKTPYWRKGAFGRGQIQITHHDNYVKLGSAIGVDLASDYNKALDLENSAAIAVVGMVRGLFTGKKLSDYKFPDSLNNKPQTHPRRIVNGVDGSDAEVSKSHRAFYKALIGAGYSLEEAPEEIPTVPVTPAIPEPAPERTRGVILAEMQALLDELKSIGG